MPALMRLLSNVNYQRVPETRVEADFVINYQLSIIN
jgi:hypothetical protein